MISIGGHDRVLGVGHAGVGVLVLEQIRDLQGLHPLQLGRVMDGAVRGRDAAVTQGAEFLHVGHVLLVGRAQFLRAEGGRERHVDAGLLELRHLVVHPVQGLGIELHAAILRLDARRRCRRPTCAAARR